MNNKGDFFIGNQKKSSSTGEEITFDTPISTVTGEDPSRLSVVFDEVIIKERLVVEGGDSGQVLSQFDGPVTFSKDVKIKGDLNTDIINVENIEVSNNITSPSGSNLDICPPIGSVVAICTNTTITGILSVTDDITAFWTSDERLKDNIEVIEDPLSKVLSISGNTFDWNEKSNKSGHDVGLIAQEIEEVLPEAVTTRDNGYLAVDYHKVVPLLVEAMKELSGKVDELQQKLQDK
jgi:hypothetical protein